MPAFKMHAPVDPSCPKVKKFRQELNDDPMTEAMGAPVGDITEGWERKHITGCKRCREYGCANIEVVGP